MKMATILGWKYALHVKWRNRCLPRCYTTVSQEFSVEEVVKKSRFKAFIARADSIDDAMVVLDRHADKNATHNCWAFRSVSNARCSDDGEPAGTAGKPILSAIENANLHNVIVIITRYYGGIKLGAGGLSRAYYSAARSATLVANRVEILCQNKVRITFVSSDIGHLYLALNEIHHDFVVHDTSKFRQAFQLDDSVDILTVQVEAEKTSIEDISNRLLSLCKGRVEILPII